MAWGAVFTGVLYWQISGYLGAVAERTLLQRAHYYGKVADADLLGELQASEVYSMPGIDAYGLFEADGRLVAGNLVKLLRNLPDDGRVHYLQRGLRTTDALDETRSSHAFLQRRADGRILVLARDGGSISAVGGIIGLFVTGEYLSVPASVGFVALWGIAVLNGVVLVSTIRSLREQGMSVEESVRLGSRMRFRPVMMTATVAMLGLIPFLFATGPGSEVQRPLAIVVIGGLLTCTLLTLVMLPTLYKWFDEESKA